MYLEDALLWQAVMWPWLPELTREAFHVLLPPAFSLLFELPKFILTFDFRMIQKHPGDALSNSWASSQWDWNCACRVNGDCFLQSGLPLALLCCRSKAQQWVLYCSFLNYVIIYILPNRFLRKCTDFTIEWKQPLHTAVLHVTLQQLTPTSSLWIKSCTF